MKLLPGKGHETIPFLYTTIFECARLEKPSTRLGSPAFPFFENISATAGSSARFSRLTLLLFPFNSVNGMDAIKMALGLVSTRSKKLQRVEESKGNPLRRISSLEQIYTRRFSPGKFNRKYEVNTSWRN